MNKLFGNSYPVRGHDGNLVSPKGLPFQSESLFGMALYDFDTLASDVGFHTAVNLPPRHNANVNAANPHHGGPPPVFHPVDEYKDLSLKEILDLSDDFLSNEEDHLLGHVNHNNVNTNPIAGVAPSNDFRMEPNHFANGSVNQFLAQRSSSLIGSSDLSNMNPQDQLLAFNLEQQLMLRQQQSQINQRMQQQSMQQQHSMQQQQHSMQQQQHNMQQSMQQQLLAIDQKQPAVTSLDSFNPKKRSRDFAPTLATSADGQQHGGDDDCDDGSTSGKDRRFRPYQAGQWSEKFEELCEYKTKTGHCLVPHTYSENLSLARWVKRQRYQYKLMLESKSSTMTPDRVAALDEIGFVWDSQGAAWGDRLGELQVFRQAYLHCNVPSNFSDNPRLATWIKCQRRQYKLFMDGKPSNMTPQRIQHLENLGFEWELRTYKKQRTN